MPPEATSITKEQMLVLVNYVLSSRTKQPPEPSHEIANGLFTQLEEQNALSQS